MTPVTGTSSYGDVTVLDISRVAIEHTGRRLGAAAEAWRRGGGLPNVPRAAPPLDLLPIAWLIAATTW